jgi:hypothetical protein
MKDALWKAVAWIVSREPVANYLIRRAQRTPYFHLVDKKTGSTYMERFWLLNPHPKLNDGKRKRFEWMPSVRAHWIKRRDLGRDQHSHPWDCRTIILRGYYYEARGHKRYLRWQGDTAVITADTFHEITNVSPDGVWTLFIMGPWKKTWGFNTPGGFVDWRTYLGLPKGGDEP